MNKLNKMLWRDIRKSWGQFVAAAVVVFVGITIFAAIYSSYLNLKNSLEYYYREYNFLDYYAEARNITPEAIKKIKALEGVKEAIGRISIDVGADMGAEKKAVVRLISLPADTHPSVNDVYLLSGDYFSSTGKKKCLVTQKFAEYYNIKKGDKLKLIINNNLNEFEIQGLVASPEYIYAIRSGISAFPSPGDFGIVYIKDEAFQTLLGYRNIFNEIHVVLEEEVDKPQHIFNKIEDILKPYGFIKGIERKDQLSNYTVAEEIKQLESFAFMFPALFLFVATMMIYIIQKRLINYQRTLIGTIKALGYSNKSIFWHYIKYSVLVTLAGSLPGVIAGIYLSKGITVEYNKIFSIPLLYHRIYGEVFFVGILFSMVFCVMAGIQATRGILSIQPAQAMRPEIPKVGKKIALEHIKPLWVRLSFGWKVSIRNVFRNRQRALLTFLGTVLTIMFLLVSMFFMDCVDYIFKFHFFEFQKQDYKVVFNRPAAYEDVVELQRIKGIKEVEPILEVPVEMKNGWHKKETVLVGITEENSLYRLRDEELNPVQVPTKGMLVAEALAQQLSVKKGDKLTLKFFLGNIEEKEVQVAGFVKQYAGFMCYMNLKELGVLLEEGKFGTGALIKVEKGAATSVEKELYDIPGVESIESRNEAYHALQEMMAFMYIFIFLLLIFGIIMGVAIIFNTTLINIMERRRELASLRVMGYTIKEIEKTIFRENALICIIALIPGIALGKAMSHLFVKQFVNKLFALEVVIYPRTYLITLVCVLVFVFLAQWASRRNIKSLDMIEVLKNREG